MSEGIEACIDYARAVAVRKLATQTHIPEYHLVEAAEAELAALREAEANWNQIKQHGRKIADDLKAKQGTHLTVVK